MLNYNIIGKDLIKKALKRILYNLPCIKYIF